MQLSEYDLEVRKGGQRFSSPGMCIYCGRSFAPQDLTDEHVIPYALGADALVIEKSCCRECQSQITRYEQAVLRHQLGVFRAQIGAPTRNKKDRISEVEIEFIEVDGNGDFMRDLGKRTIPLAEAPLMINLWQSPPAEILKETVVRPSQPWTFFEKEVAVPLCRDVAKEFGAKNVGMKLGVVNRFNYLRALAKTAHAYAVACVGLKAFEPCLTDIILNRSDDVGRYVGDIPGVGPFDTTDHTMQISLGEIPDGPAQGMLVVRIQLYPSLGSPEHLIVVGRATEDIGLRFQ